jgi:hypothetical protein
VTNIIVDPRDSFHDELRHAAATGPARVGTVVA